MEIWGRKAVATFVIAGVGFVFFKFVSVIAGGEFSKNWFLFTIIILAYLRWIPQFLRNYAYESMSVEIEVAKVNVFWCDADSLPRNIVFRIWVWRGVIVLCFTCVTLAFFKILSLLSGGNFASDWFNITTFILSFVGLAAFFYHDYVNHGKRIEIGASMAPVPLVDYNLFNNLNVKDWRRMLRSPNYFIKTDSIYYDNKVTRNIVKKGVFNNNGTVTFNDQGGATKNEGESEEEDVPTDEDLASLAELVQYAIRTNKDVSVSRTTVKNYLKNGNIQLVESVKRGKNWVGLYPRQKAEERIAHCLASRKR